MTAEDYLQRCGPYAEGDKPIPGYQLRKRIGEGSFGEVWEATKPGSPKTALKIVNLRSTTPNPNESQIRKAGRRELAATEELKRLTHPFLVPIYSSYVKTQTGQIIPSESVNLAVDDAEGGDPWTELFIAMQLGERTLQNRLEECASESRGATTGIPSSELKQYILDVARALDWLYGQKQDGKPLVHCDIKPQNLLLVHGHAKVCDYGLMREPRRDLQATSMMGTPIYAAPELLGNIDSHDFKAFCSTPTGPTSTTDQFSLALTYYTLRTGTFPFARILLDKLENPSYELLLPLLSAKFHEEYQFYGVGAGERRVLRRSLNRDYRKRWESCQEFAEKLFQAIADDERPKSLWERIVGRNPDEPPIEPPIEPSPKPPLRSLGPYKPGDIPVSDHTVERVRATEGDDQWLDVRDSSGNQCELIIRMFSPSEASPESTYPGEIQLDPAQDDWDRMIRLRGCKHSTLEQLRYWWKDDKGDVFSSAEEALETSVPRELILKRPFAESLEERGKRLSTLTPMELRGWLGGIADLLDMLEDRGRYHGDIHPANIFVVDGKVRLGPARWQPLVDHTEGSRKYTDSEIFAAPLLLDTDSQSQANLRAKDDQYALAVSYFRLRTGRKSPFTSDTADAIEAVTPDALDFAKRNEYLNLRGLDETEKQAVRKALAPSPNGRWRTCREFIDQLTPPSPATADSHEGVATRRLPAAAATAVCALIVGASAFLWWFFNGTTTAGTPGRQSGNASQSVQNPSDATDGVSVSGQTGQSGEVIPPATEPVDPFKEFNTHLDQNQFVKALGDLNRLWPQEDKSQCQQQLEKLVVQWVEYQSVNIPKFDPSTPTAAFTTTTHSGLPLPNDEIWKDRFGTDAKTRLVDYWRKVFFQVKTDADRHFDQPDFRQSRIRYEELARQSDLYEQIVSDDTHAHWIDIPWRIARIDAAELLRGKREADTSMRIQKFLDKRLEASGSTDREYEDTYFATIRRYLMSVCHADRNLPRTLDQTNYWRAILEAKAAQILTGGIPSQDQVCPLQDFEGTFLDLEIANFDRLLAESRKPTMPGDVAMAIPEPLRTRLTLHFPEYHFRKTLEDSLKNKRAAIHPLTANLASLTLHFSQVKTANEKSNLDWNTVVPLEEVERGVFTPVGFAARREMYELKLRALSVLNTEAWDLRIKDPDPERNGRAPLEEAISVWTDTRWLAEESPEWTKSLADRIVIELEQFQLPEPIPADLIPALGRVCEKLRLRWPADAQNLNDPLLTAEGKAIATKLIRALNRSLITHLTVVLQPQNKKLRAWDVELRALETIASKAGDPELAAECLLLKYEYGLESGVPNNLQPPTHDGGGRKLHGYRRYLEWQWAAAAKDHNSSAMVEPAALKTLSDDWPEKADHAWQTSDRRRKLIEAMHRLAKQRYLPTDDVFARKTPPTDEALRLLDASLKVAQQPNGTHLTREIWKNSLSVCYLLDKWLTPTRKMPFVSEMLERLDDASFALPNQPTATQLLASYVYHSKKNEQGARQEDLLGRFLESLKLVQRGESGARRPVRPKNEAEILAQFHRMVWVIIDPLPQPQGTEAKEALAIAHYFAALSGYRHQTFQGPFAENRRQAKDCCQRGLPFAAGDASQFWTMKLRCLRIAILLDEWFDGVDTAGLELDKEVVPPKTKIIEPFDRFVACALDLLKTSQALSSGKDEEAIRVEFDKSVEEMEELFGPNGAAAQLSIIDRARFQIMLSKAHYTRGNSTDKPLSAWPDAKQKKGEPYYHFDRAYKHIAEVEKLPKQELLDHLRFWACQHHLMCLERLGCHLRLASHYEDLERLLFNPAPDNDLQLIARRVGTHTALLENHLTRIRLIRQLLATRIDRFGNSRSQLQEQEFAEHLMAVVKEVMDLCVIPGSAAKRICGDRPLYEVADAMTLVPRIEANPAKRGEKEDFEHKVQEFLQGYMKKGFQQDPRYGLPVTLYVLSNSFESKNVSQQLLEMAKADCLWQGIAAAQCKEWFLSMVEWAERSGILLDDQDQLDNFAPRAGCQFWLKTYRKLSSRDVNAIAEDTKSLVEHAKYSPWFVCRTCTRLLLVDFDLDKSLPNIKGDVVKEREFNRQKRDILQLVLELGVIKQTQLGTLLPESDHVIPVGLNPGNWFASMPEVNAQRLIEWYRLDRFADEFFYLRQSGKDINIARKPFYLPMVQCDMLQKEVLKTPEQNEKFKQVLPLLK